jgi:hypothetical protein
MSRRDQASRREVMDMMEKGNDSNQSDITMNQMTAVL